MTETVEFVVNFEANIGAVRCLLQAQEALEETSPFTDRAIAFFRTAAKQWIDDPFLNARLL